MDCNMCLKQIYDKLVKDSKYNRDIELSLKQIKAMIVILKKLIGNNEQINFWLQTCKMLQIEYKALDFHYENRSNDVIKKLDLILNLNY